MLIRNGHEITKKLRNVNGEFKEITKVLRNVNGVFKEVYSSRPTDWTYTVTSNVVSITAYIGSDTDVVLPAASKFGGTSIQFATGTTTTGVFYNNRTTMTSLTLNDDLTVIGEYSCYECSALTSLTIPSSVTTIGIGAFQYCTGLTSVNYNATSAGNISANTNAPFRYSGKSSGCALSIGSNVTTVPNYMFYDFDNLTSATIGNSVTTIGTSAFGACSLMTTVTMGTSVQSLSTYAFGYCSALTTISLPSTVTSIGGYAFQYCTSMTSITMSSGIQTIGTYAFRVCSALTSISIGSTLTSLGNYAFYNCTSLATATIGGTSSTTMGSYVFRLCTSLATLTIPFVGATMGGTTNTHFGYIFGDSAYLTSSTASSTYIPSSLTTLTISGGSIASYACRYVTSLTKLNINVGVSSIGSLAFSYCTGLTYLYAWNNDDNTMNSSIEGSAFWECTSLSFVMIGSLLDSTPQYYITVGVFAFGNCTSLATLYIGYAVSKIYNAAFYNCSAIGFAHFMYYYWLVNSSDTSSGATAITVNNSSGSNITYLISTYVSRYWFSEKWY